MEVSRIKSVAPEMQTAPLLRESHRASAVRWRVNPMGRTITQILAAGTWVFLHAGNPLRRSPAEPAADAEILYEHIRGIQRIGSAANQCHPTTGSKLRRNSASSPIAAKKHRPQHHFIKKSSIPSKRKTLASRLESSVVMDAIHGTGVCRVVPSALRRQIEQGSIVFPVERLVQPRNGRN